MEGVLPKSESLNTSWLERKAEAGPEAAKLIASIEGYEALDTQAKIGKLDTLFRELEASNDNRFVAEVISLKQRSLEIDAEQAELERQRALMSAELAA